MGSCSLKHLCKLLFLNQIVGPVSRFLIRLPVGIQVGDVDSGLLTIIFDGRMPQD